KKNYLLVSRSYEIAIQKTTFSGENCMPETENEEAMFTAYVRKEGRITVAKEIRDMLSIEEGALVECKIKKVK
ncbi:MAG: hypothetical protein JSW72_00165, partial [Candidatus Bathyarchaeota archaeon]